jgi:hypothetical protein
LIAFESHPHTGQPIGLPGKWPECKRSFERWLAPENFDSEGRQRTSLAALNGQKA